MILIIKHIAIEGPETLGDFLAQKGHGLVTVEIDKGDKLPSQFGGIDAVVCLGGPMNVYQETQYPFLKEEHVFIQRILKERIPFLGICLGSQLLAKACGAEVTRSPKKEVGLFDVTLTSDGQSDPLLSGLPERFPVFQWHEDMFQVPDHGVLLARGKSCPHQAFRVVGNAYGLQFHVEVTERTIDAWCREYFRKGMEGEKERFRLLEEFQNRKENFIKNAEKIYNNFLKIVTKNQDEGFL